MILFDICNKNQRKLCFLKLSAEFVSEKLLITYGSSLIVYTWSSPLPPRYHSEGLPKGYRRDRKHKTAPEERFCVRCDELDTHRECGGYCMKPPLPGMPLLMLPIMIELLPSNSILSV